LSQGDEESGIIGIEAKERLQRLPSSVYWSGLASWAVRRVPRSREQYHRYLDRFYRIVNNASTTDDSLSDEIVATNWDPCLPAIPAGFLEQTNFELSKEEASYLQDRLMNRHPGRLLTCLINYDIAVDTDFVWNHPVISDLPENLQANIEHAQFFSETVLGAALFVQHHAERGCGQRGIR